jgi:hypothetical protein
MVIFNSNDGLDFDSILRRNGIQLDVTYPDWLKEVLL